MPSTQVLSISQIRSGYINRRTLYNSLANRFYGRKSPSLPGYSLPEVEYITEDGKGCTTLRDYDIAILRSMNTEKPREYLGLILKANAGNENARIKLKERVEHAFSIIQPDFSNIKFTEDGYIIPSTTEVDYPEELVSNKGSNLLQLMQRGYPVPDFTILTSKVYNLSKDYRKKKMAEAIENLEGLTAQEFGSSRNPLLIAMRCAMPRYIPGIMPTFLNIGVTEKVLSSLAEHYGKEAASRIVLTNLKTLFMKLDPEGYTAFAKIIRPDLDKATNNQLSLRLMKVIKKKDPLLLEDPYYQAFFFLSKAYEDYVNDLDFLRTFMHGKNHFPAIILQKMVCSALNDNSYAGVLFSRHPRTGRGMQFQIARAMFGEEIMTGGIITTEQIDFMSREEVMDGFPAIYHFSPQLPEIERFFNSPVTIEFAAEDGLFALLQANPSELTGRGMLISVMDLYRSGVITQPRVIELIKPYHLRQLESGAIDPESLKELKPFCFGTSVLPRTAISGKIYFSTESAAEAKNRGETAILAKDTFVPADANVMQKVDGIISLTHVAIHVVTTSQGLGIPALLDLEKRGITITSHNSLVNANGDEIKEGDNVTISSRYQILFMGKASFKSPRLFRYMEGEKVELKEDEKDFFAQLARDYTWYKEIVENLQTVKIDNIQNLFKLIRFDFKDDGERKSALVNSWFNIHKNKYIEEIFKSKLGDHLVHRSIYNLLSIERKIKLLKAALLKSLKENLRDYKAGCFMLGLFISTSHPVYFWESFSPQEISMLLNEWICYEKYIKILFQVGEKKINKAREYILTQGLPDIYLHSGNISVFIPLKLSKIDLKKVKQAIPEGSDPQTDELLNILLKPYSDFYDFEAKWSVHRLEVICEENNVSVPAPNDK